MKRAADRKTKRTSVCLSRNELRLVRKLAREKGVGLSELMRDLAITAARAQMQEVA